MSGMNEVRHSDETHGRIINVDAMLKQRLDVIVLDGYAAIDT